MSIIEKLGIKSEYKTSMVNGGIVLKLENQRNELMEALIEDSIDAELALEELEKDFPDINKIYNLVNRMCARSSVKSEKATGKTWAEIKELLG